jgi:hypothetical protein
MKSIYISNDEWYPVWYLETVDNGIPAEVSDEEYQKIKQVFKDFGHIQKRLKELGTAR